MDLLVYLPSCLLFTYYPQDIEKSHSTFVSFFLMVFSPALLLIDHGHFQYNSVCLGLVLLSLCCIERDHDYLGSFLFVMAIGYKQMALYYSLVFFVWLLRKCYDQRSVFHLLCIGLTVIASFALLFLPFCIHLPKDLSPLSSLGAVVQRMFPWDRWVFEDKVASVWCTLNNVIKLNRLFTAEQMKLMCLIATICGCLPSLFLLWKKPSANRVYASLFSCSMSFFLFSYHGIRCSLFLTSLVHEKTILFPLLPMLLLGKTDPDEAIWFSFMASYSMIPLYVKDSNLLLGLVYTSVILFVLPPQKPIGVTPNRAVNWFFTVCLMGVVCCSVLYYALPPPARYPDLHSVLISSVSCGYFILEYVSVLVKY